MANKYNVGETVICERNVKDDDGNYVDPATSMTISIYDPNNGAEIENQAMVGGNPPTENTGKYHYDYNTTSANVDGIYLVYYTATDGTRITIRVETFILE